MADRTGSDLAELVLMIAQLAAVAFCLVAWWLQLPGWSSPAGGVLYLAPLVVAAGQYTRNALRSARARVAWLLLVASLGLLAVENVARDAAVRLGGDVRLVLSGLIGVGAQFALAGGVILLMSTRGHRAESGWRIDALVAACGASAVGMVLWDLVAMPPGSTIGWALYLAPGIVGLATALVLAQAVLVGGWRDRVLLLMLGAVSARELATITMSLRAKPGHEATGFDPRLAWVLFAVLGSLAAFVDRRPSRWRPTKTLPPVVAGSWIVPSLCLSGAVAILVWGQYRPPRLEVTVLAVATLGIAVVRTAVGNRELQRLAAAAVESRTDDLSGLLNRRGFTEELERAALSGPGALLVVDIDRFREVNELLGHEAGDDVLRVVAARLRRAASGSDVLSRLGGDEFAVLIDEPTTFGSAEAARHMRAAMDEPVPVGGMAVRLNASVGVRCWQAGEADADRILSQANHAVRQAKQRRSGVERYDPERDALGSRRLALTDALRRSIARRELVLHYQPKVDLFTGQVVGVEALARWTNEDGPVSPALFIEVAEEGGLIGELTRAMLEQALAQARRWADAGSPLVVSVNLSPRNLLDPDLAGRVRALLAKHGVSARQLILEITETTLLPDPIRSSVVLAELRRIGVRLSIDDYGTGHAALAYLRDFPVDELKLDRSYVAGMVHDPRTAAIVRSTVEMGRQLGLTVVAEGVERQEELEAVAACGCNVVQGYLMCRPLPADELSAWLRRGSVGAPVLPLTRASVAGRRADGGSPLPRRASR